MMRLASTVTPATTNLSRILILQVVPTILLLQMAFACLPLLSVEALGLLPPTNTYESRIRERGSAFHLHSTQHRLPQPHQSLPPLSMTGRKTMEERGQVRQNSTASSEQAYCQVDSNNFWRNTAANFTVCDAPDSDTTPPSFRSNSGSLYWDVNGTHVMRLSDHWTGQHGVDRIVDCHWTIDVVQTHKKQYVCGMCRYRDFVQRKATNKRPKKFQAQGFGGAGRETAVAESHHDAK